MGFPIPGSLQINLLFTIFAEQAQTQIASCKLVFSSEDNSARGTHTGQRPSAIVGRPVRSAAAKAATASGQTNGGAERDRTADPLLAKQVLSQLSYSPIYLGIWWAWEDLNFRPHAYQACALTN